MILASFFGVLDFFLHVFGDAIFTDAVFQTPFVKTPFLGGLKIYLTYSLYDIGHILKLGNVEIG